MNALLACLPLLALPALLSAAEANLVRNPGFEEADPSARSPAGYDLEGGAAWRIVGGKDEFATRGVGFPGDVRDGGAVSQMVTGIDPAKGRWLTFRFRGLPEEGWAVADGGLEMKIEFFGKDGTSYLDAATRTISREVERDRQQFTVNGDHGRAGAAVWRAYEFEELIPFPEVDAVRISVRYADASAAVPRASFFVDDFSLVQRAASRTGKIDPADAPGKAVAALAAVPDPQGLVPLGGRWYYQPAPDETGLGPDGKWHGALTVTEENADRLYYKSGRWITPFVGNMTAWLRAGYKDLRGQVVTQDRFVPDSVTVSFRGDGFLTLHAKNLPNHPTARFPDTTGTQGYNPSYIQELDKTYHLPLDPVPDPDAKAMDLRNTGNALPMGSIGVAVNGVVFYNPFDAGGMDATGIMDRCCGHPSPDNRYHYHKYPICVNTPFVDKGDGHSELIGFAFDGLPIYGPYEEAGVLARDDAANPLNAFNAHHDEVHGWHYHVTPGKFPYIIGGYFAKVERSNLEGRPQAPPGGSLPGGPGGEAGPPGGGPGGPGGPGGRPPPPPFE